jgi:peptidoglycan hydrolase-like protein with peptidoglycan-binding domain
MGLFDILGNQAADLVAINQYFNAAKPNNPAATKLRDDWSKWYMGLGTYDRNMNGSTIKEAENRRNAFNIANAGTKAKAEAIKDQLKTGISREEMQSKPRVADEAGNYRNAGGITVASAAKGSLAKGSRPTIRQGSTGESVKAWQAVIGAKPVDGIFGPATAGLTKKYQADNGLTVDGVVGPASWGAALGASDDDAKDMSFASAAVTPVMPSTVKASDAPTGTVPQKVAIKKPVPTKKPKTKPKKLEPEIKEKVAKVSQKPAAQSVATPRTPESEEIIEQQASFVGMMQKSSWLARSLAFLGIVGAGASIAYVVKEKD